MPCCEIVSVLSQNRRHPAKSGTAGAPGRGQETALALMTRERFHQLVLEALDTIPKRFRREIKNVAVIVAQEPPAYLLEEMDIEPPDTLFGLYQGTPLTERQ